LKIREAQLRKLIREELEGMQAGAAPQAVDLQKLASVANGAASELEAALGSLNDPQHAELKQALTMALRPLLGLSSAARKAMQQGR